jgi:preprotein translocase subunit SecF
MSAGTVGAERRGIRGVLSDIFHERTHFDFVGRARIWAFASGAVILASVVALLLGGLSLGIDFEGGTQWQLTRASGSASVDAVRHALADTAAADAKVLILGDDGVRVQAEALRPAQARAVTQALADEAGIDVSEVSLSDVGPTWGDQVSRKALVALAVFFALLAAYLTFRFEWRMAIAAIVAVVHDIVITVGVYAIFRFEVTPATVIAFITILGFSLYDTVVVFDKVRENAAHLGAERGDSYSQMVNRSLNQVLMRSLNTSFVALLPVASLLVVGSGFLGAVALRDFGVALFIGLLVGAYSSIFVATPLLAWLKEREPRNRALRERFLVLGRTGGPAVATAAATGTAPPPARERDPDLESIPAVTRPRDVAARPRQQRGRKRR